MAGSWDGKVKIWCRESSDCLFTIANKVFNACIYIFSGVEQERGRKIAREGEREEIWGKWKLPRLPFYHCQLDVSHLYLCIEWHGAKEER